MPSHGTGRGCYSARKRGEEVSARRIRPPLQRLRPMQSARAFHTAYGRDRECTGTFFGPTCDSMDVVATDFPVEELFVGDWLAFAQSGAYTSAAATTFNGMPKPTAHYCRSRQPSPNSQ